MAQRIGSRPWYRIQAKANAEVAEIWIYDEIGEVYDFWTGESLGVSAKSFLADLQALPESVKTIRVHVNSPGGNVFDAVAIANMLRAQSTEKGRTVEMLIEALAASAATIVTSAGDSIKISSNAVMMIHNPSGDCRGQERDMREMADALASIRSAMVATYRWVSQLSAEAIQALMDQATWMGAEECVANGLAMEVIAPVAVTARFDPRSLKALGEIPEQYRERVAALIASPEPPAPVPEPVAAVSAALVPPPAPPEPPATVSADPSAVLAACEASGCLNLARGLIEAKATTEQVTARLQRAKEVRALCAMAKCPELAGDYITADVPVATVKAQLTKITARQDRIEIDASLPPDAGDAKQRARLNPSAIYAERNARVGQRGA